MTDLVDLASIRDAARRIEGIAVRTPLLESPWPDLWLKPETLQPMGAFKIRGAVTAISRLGAAERARGILAHSSGNHAQAVAYAARRLGIDAHIVIPDNAPARKIDATRGYGATVELVPLTERFSRPEELQRETGKAMIPPFDSLDVIAGQGTVGLEIAEDAPDVAVVLVPVSGGGLISGTAAAIAALLPNAVVIGVEPELAGDAAESFRTGVRQEWSPHDTARTMADGLRTFSVGHLHLAAHPGPRPRHRHGHRGRDRRGDPAAADRRPAARRTVRRGQCGGVLLPPRPAAARQDRRGDLRRQHRSRGAAHAAGVTGLLLSMALPVADTDVAVRIAVDAVHVGVTRLHLTGPVSVDTVRSLRAATRALVSGGTGDHDAELDLVGYDHPAVTGHTVFTDAARNPVLVDMLPPAADDDAGLVAALGARLAGLPADGPLRSVVAGGDRATPAVLTALAAGAHLRIGPGIGSG